MNWLSPTAAATSRWRRRLARRRGAIAGGPDPGSSGAGTRPAGRPASPPPLARALVPRFRMSTAGRTSRSAWLLLDGTPSNSTNVRNSPRTGATASPAVRRAGSTRRRCSGRRPGRTTATASGRTRPTAAPPRVSSRRTASPKTRRNHLATSGQSPPPAGPAATPVSSRRRCGPHVGLVRPTVSYAAQKSVPTAPENSSAENRPKAGYPRDSSIRWPVAGGVGTGDAPPPRPAPDPLPRLVGVGRRRRQGRGGGSGRTTAPGRGSAGAASGGRPAVIGGRGWPLKASAIRRVVTPSPECRRADRTAVRLPRVPSGRAPGARPASRGAGARRGGWRARSPRAGGRRGCPRRGGRGAARCGSVRHRSRGRRGVGATGGGRCARVAGGRCRGGRSRPRASSVGAWPPAWHTAGRCREAWGHRRRGRVSRGRCGVGGGRGRRPGLAATPPRLAPRSGCRRGRPRRRRRPGSGPRRACPRFS